jgi:hypothetical protein
MRLDKGEMDCFLGCWLYMYFRFCTWHVIDSDDYLTHLKYILPSASALIRYLPNCALDLD